MWKDCRVGLFYHAHRVSDRVGIQRAQEMWNTALAKAGIL